MFTSILLGLAVLLGVFHFTGSIEYAIIAWVGLGFVLTVRTAFYRGT